MAKGIIELTDSAKDYPAKVGDPNVSLTVKGGGCSGFYMNGVLLTKKQLWLIYI